MDDHFRERRHEVIHRVVDVTYVNGGISLWRTSGQPWMSNDRFIARCATHYLTINNVQAIGSPTVIASQHRNSGFNVINIKTSLSDRDIMGLITRAFGTVTLAGRSCSVQKTKSFTERAHFRDESEDHLRDSRFRPFQLDSISLMQTGGDFIDHQSPWITFHARNIASSLGRQVTDLQIIPITTGIAVNIYFATSFPSEEELFKFIITHELFTSRSSVASVTISGRSFAVTPTPMACDRLTGEYHNRRTIDARLLDSLLENEQHHFTRSPPRRRPSPRSRSPQRFRRQ